MFYYCGLFSGSASSVSVGSGTTVTLDSCIISSTNTNAVTGAGTLNYIGLIFQGTSFKINTTTQSGGVMQGGQTQAPSAGFIGEQIRSAVSSVSLSSVTTTNITSISLTAGIWDVSGNIAFVGIITGVNFIGVLNTTSATLGTSGDNQSATPTPPTASAESSVCIPAWRVTLTATTTVYLIARANYSVGTLTVNGRISATRVG